MLIAFEGIEGAGKSSVMAKVASFWAQGQICCTREPGGSVVADQIRQLLLQPTEQEPMVAETECLLVFASRVQHVVQRIKPALAAGQWVFTDRYIDATYAYQGAGRGVSETFIDQLVTQLSLPLPDRVMILDIPVAKAWERVATRGHAKDRIEQESDAFFERIRQCYLRRAEQDPMRYRVIDATASFDEVVQSVKQAIDDCPLVSCS